jgi:hypothetical protein
MPSRLFLSVVLSLFALFLTGCTPWRASYLADIVNQATQDDITHRLGPPDVNRSLDNGGGVWRYRYYDRYVSGKNGRVSGGSDCVEYLLTFDDQKVLRNWVRQRC